jgi:diguanylate cyclase (GGDEF)-like protein
MPHCESGNACERLWHYSGAMASKRSTALPNITRARDAREWIADYEESRHGPVTFMLIGIRDLKQVNERFGRDAGNMAISASAARLRAALIENLSQVILLARLPGREFLLVLSGDMTAEAVEGVTKKLLTSLADALPYKGEKFHISPRIGIAVAQARESGMELQSRAQGALSDAYARKGRKHSVAALALDLQSGITRQLDRELRGALDTGAITIMFQPQFAVADGRLTGVEALARWHHPSLGEVGAGHLFAAADRCDLREELSALIQERAIALAAKWSAELSALRLSINLGADELGESHWERLGAMLKTHGFDPARLTLELTEESLVRDIDLAGAELEKLRAIGVRIAVDDFGTGYSSLSYLKTLPIDYLKLDKGMTPDISGTGKDRIILRAIIAMAKALELGIIAEGVEREEELDMLRAEGCDYFQGFLCSPPLTPEEFERFALKRL